MKNSACELFCVDHGVTYTHAFGYIRQLAILLRGGMKTKTKASRTLVGNSSGRSDDLYHLQEAYKQVYNWQYAHCVDFWALVLGRACDAHAEAERGGQESELRPLIYPLVQVSLGAIKYVLHVWFSLCLSSSQTHFEFTVISIPLTHRTLDAASDSTHAYLRTTDALSPSYHLLYPHGIWQA